MENSKLAVGPIIYRYDSRFYVPLVRTQTKKGDKRNIITLRVTSDGFDTEEETMEFARHLERAWNIYVDTYGVKD
jgi:hypothetical protein